MERKHFLAILGCKFDFLLKEKPLCRQNEWTLVKRGGTRTGIFFLHYHPILSVSFFLFGPEKNSLVLLTLNVNYSHQPNFSMVLLDQNGQVSLVVQDNVKS